MFVGKKGEITTKEIVEILLGAAAVFVLIFLMYSLLAPTFDKDDETAKSYLKTLKREIGVADSGKEGSFDMLNLGDDKVKFYLVYFGEKIRVKLDDNYDFKSVGSRKNHACVCYWRKEKVFCPACEDFDIPILQRVRDVGDAWFIYGSDSAWKIRRDGDYYYEFFQ